MKNVVGLVRDEGGLAQTLDRLQGAGFAAESVAVVRDGDARQSDCLACADSFQPGDTLLMIRTADEHAARAMDVLVGAGVQNVKLCANFQEDPQLADTPPERDRLSNALCWSARLFGLVLIGVVLSFFIGEGLMGGDMPNLSTMGLVEEVLMLALLTTLLGLILAWRWEAIGGLIIVAGVLLFEGFDWIAGGSRSISPLNPLFLLVAALFLWDWWRTVGRNRSDSRPTVTSGAQ